MELQGVGHDLATEPQQLSQDNRLKAMWDVFTFQEHDKGYNFRLSPSNTSVPSSSGFFAKPALCTVLEGLRSSLLVM